MLLNRLRRDSKRVTSKRVWRGTPAILLGIILNLLDIVSTGVLVFPTSGEQSGFNGLEVESISIYIISILTSQLVLTLGGSKFHGAFGSMLVEVLPLLHNLANFIERRLREKKHALLPTVMVSYALCSILMSAIFLILRVLHLGFLISCFPTTILHGMVGAIGIELIITALEFGLPPNTQELTLTTAGQILFAQKHIAITCTTIIVAIALALTVKASYFARWTRGFTRHPLYIPGYMAMIAIIFWIVVAALGQANSEGLVQLASKGWLFKLQAGHNSAAESSGKQWLESINYWRLFRFNDVDWPVIGAAMPHILLLVFIGVINLPLAIAALSEGLHVSAANPDRELLGHAASNFLAGFTGSIPNLIVFSYSRLFTEAHGGRFESFIVLLATASLMFLTQFILPYIPKLLGSTIVLYIGIDLTLTAVWGPVMSMNWAEYLVVSSTLVTSVFAGFAPGLGVGLGLSLLLHFAYCVVDSKTVQSHQSQKQDGSENSPFQLGRKRAEDTISLLERCDTSITLHNPEERTHPKQVSFSYGQEDDTLGGTVEILELYGYACFATVATIETAINNLDESTRYLIFDLTNLRRMETSVVQLIALKQKEISYRDPPVHIILAGVRRQSGVHSDLIRGDVKCYWAYEEGIPIPSSKTFADEMPTITFTDIKHAKCWCRERTQVFPYHSISEEAMIRQLFSMISPSHYLSALSCLPDSDLPLLFRLRHAGISFIVSQPGTMLYSPDDQHTEPTPSNFSDSCTFLVLRGCVSVTRSDASLETQKHQSRPSVGKLLGQVTVSIYRRARNLLPSWNMIPKRVVDRTKDVDRLQTHRRYILPGDCSGLLESYKAHNQSASISVVSGPCWIVCVDTTNVVGLKWASTIQGAFEMRNTSLH